jgi:hypothetical protein
MLGENMPSLSLTSHPRVLRAGSRFLDDYSAVMRLTVLDRLQPDAELLLARARHEAGLGNFIASRATAQTACTLHPEWGPAHALAAQADWHLALLQAEAIEPSPWHTPSAETCRALLDGARQAYVRAARACPSDTESQAAATWIGRLLAYTRTEGQTIRLLQRVVHHEAQ